MRKIYIYPLAYTAILPRFFCFSHHFSSPSIQTFSESLGSLDSFRPRRKSKQLPLSASHSSAQLISGYSICPKELY